MKELIYKVINLFTFGKGLSKKFHGIRVHMPTRYINYFPSDYEKENYDFLKAHIQPGDTVLDIGAHMGLFSVITARLAQNNCRIFAFEPSRNTFAILQKTISINSLTGVIEPMHGAVGKGTGTITFYNSNTVGDNSNTVVSYRTDEEVKAVQVQLYGVDDFVTKHNISHLKFIKIDVEGAEYDVLLGAGETLKSLKPYCTLGIHPEAILAKGDSLEQIYDLIAECNYTINENGKEVDRTSFCSVNTLVDFHLIPKP